MNIRFFRRAFAITLAFACPPLFAHPGHGAGFPDGLLHPLAGLDHLIAAIAIGIWIARQAPQMQRALPASFLASIGLGVVIGATGFAPAWLEQGLAASVLLAGLLLLFTVRLSPLSALCIATFTATLHGIAHGAEMASNGNAISYAAGLVLGTAIPLLIGRAVGLGFSNSPRLSHLAALGITTCGAILAAQTF
jgi:urease accessory protein